MKLKRLKSISLLFIPPIISKIIFYIIKSSKIRFEGNYHSWQSALEKSSGYQSENILRKVLASTLKVQSGEAEFERDSVLFEEIQYSWPTLAGLLWIAARNNGELNVLDFGGSLGSSYFQNRKFLGLLPNVSWNIVEQEHYVQAAKQHLESKFLKFYSSLEAYLKENSPNVILISAALQYVPEPINLINKLSSVGAQLLIIDRTPISLIPDHRLTVQRVPENIYSASYPMWIFSRDQLNLTLNKFGNIISQTLGNDGHSSTSDGLGISFECIILEFFHDKKN
jgi:putative methyltransferase (TIGR04325 family)